MNLQDTIVGNSQKEEKSGDLTDAVTTRTRAAIPPPPARKSCVYSVAQTFVFVFQLP